MQATDTLEGCISVHYTCRITQEELQELKELIIEKIRDIEETFPFLVEETQAIEPSVGLGRLTRMEALSEKGINEYVLRKNREDLQKMQNALARIEKGSYGNCIRCGKEIPLGRLRLVPEALVCVPCSSKGK